jgi:AraC-like DNA-binding protein
MLRAMALLAAPAQSVQQTASTVGFDSMGSFARAFVQFCGETPSSYRRRVNKIAV